MIVIRMSSPGGAEADCGDEKPADLGMMGKPTVLANRERKKTGRIIYISRKRTKNGPDRE